MLRAKAKKERNEATKPKAKTTNETKNEGAGEGESTKEERRKQGYRDFRYIGEDKQGRKR